MQRALISGAMSASSGSPGFAVKAKDGRARSGLLTTKTGVINTPAVLLYTRRGGPLSLTPDMLRTLDPPLSAVQLNVMQFMENPDAALLREYGQGAHGFLGLRGLPLLAANRDPTFYEYGARPSTDREVYVSIHSGGHMVTPARYMDTVAALQPDMYVTLADEVTSDARPKRIATSTRRTTAWLEACLELHSKHQQQQQQQQGQGDRPQQQAGQGGPDQRPHEGDGLQATVGGGEQGSGLRLESGPVPGPLSGSIVLAALGGGAVEAERARAAKAVAEKEGVGGYALCGLGTGEAPELRPALIAASLDALPRELLDAVAAGVDLFDCSYVAQVTAGGYALSFPLQPPQEGQQQQGVSAGSAPDIAVGTDDTKLNLWSMSYRLDQGPLLPGCRCFACSHHSRAYVHHLLNAHEMLADVLLEAHNTQHMNAFVQAIRDAIAQGRFEQYRQWFRSLRSQPLAPVPRHLTAKRRTQPAGAAGAAGAGSGADSGEEAEGRQAKWVRV